MDSCDTRHGSPDRAEILSLLLFIFAVVKLTRLQCATHEWFGQIDNSNLEPTNIFGAVFTSLETTLLSDVDVGHFLYHTELL